MDTKYVISMKADCTNGFYSYSLPLLILVLKQYIASLLSFLSNFTEKKNVVFTSFSVKCLHTV